MQPLDGLHRYGGMMDHVPELAKERRGQISDAPAFLSYCLQKAGPHCPFIKLSSEKLLLYASIYELDELRSISASGDVAEGLFLVALAHVELFRADRAALRAGDKLLICDNVLIREPTGLDAAALRRLIGWPHWMLKCLYSSKSVMFGKFWKGEQLTTVRGFDLQPPEVSFISIRSAVMDRDLNFVDNSDQIASELQAATLDTDTPLPDKTEVADLLKLPASERALVYESLKSWAKHLLPSAQSH